MGKSLIITEKPSVAQEFARVLHVNGRNDGYIEDGNYVITWCVGHLVGLVYPESYDIKYKKWRLEDLPFLPKEYKYDVIGEVSRQYRVVHGMLMREDIDRVYWAGDAGKEGQTIEENIRRFGGVRPGMEELRVWIDSQTEEEILRGIKEARPMSEYENLGNSGIMRTIEDYAMGINFSRVLSVRYGGLLNDAANTRSYTAIAVGRVMTCVLGMVVIREREIRDFKETPFYRVTGRFSEAGIEGEWKAVEGSGYYESPLLYKENGFKEEKDAKTLIESLRGKAYVHSVEKGTTRKKAPLLFNLAELQAECARRFKISPDETLEVAQALYEKKLTTYPRTDARVLSVAVAKEIHKNIAGLRRFEPVAAFAEKILSERLYGKLPKTQYTDDSKITDHYAVIPTGQLTELGSLNALQRAVFELIVRRFLSIFYPPAEYQTVKLQVSVEAEGKKEMFFSSCKILKKPGYLEIAGIPKKKDRNDPTNPSRGLDRVTAGAYSRSEGETEQEETADPEALLAFAEKYRSGDEISVGGYAIREGKTSPPKRYTSGSMVLAMENAGQLIEDEELREQIRGSGIGTSATRAEIIKKLVRIHYLSLNKKTQILTPESLGEMVYEVVNMTVPALLNPKMTASWEKGLEGITQGTVDFWEYRGKLEDFIRTETLKMRNQNLREALTERISAFTGKNAKGVRKKLGVSCPVCGGEMVTTPFGYGCSNYKNDKSGCNFNIGDIAGVALTEEQVKELMEKGATGTIRGFQSKNGKKFDACLKLGREQETGKVSVDFDFSGVEPELLPDVVCPVCGGKIRKTSFGYGCVNYTPGETESCRFSVGTIAGKRLGEAQMIRLLKDGRTDTIRGFKSKNGKKFDACLALGKNENGQAEVQFDFENVEVKKVKGVKCPLCGGGIIVTPFGYGCASYREGGCRFSIGKMAEKSFTESQVKQLLNDGITETMRGFKSKNGKKFDARVALARDEAGKVTGLRFDFNHVEAKRVKDVKCPKCGGEVVVTPFGFACANYQKEDPQSCRFLVGRIASVSMKEAQLKELLTKKRTGVISGFVAKTGMKFDAPLKLSEEGDIVFDFPEKPKPVESKLPCPRCGRLLFCSQWKYTCDCGFQIWHTLAHVELSEDILKELFATGKTRHKVSGFTSKAGNTFDACLKYENGQISFDFDNPGEPRERPRDEAAGQEESEGKEMKDGDSKNLQYV
ncbi:MAG: topoisomerase C-terminal repeat-containing protein [Muribaculaceae bacterium]|nr:topoisomerase C-terminal repeat-containing protein [Roseburia sp.]MCM1430474.1 topoisomerase C-terminal repeat-containing protein [Muribaculaceae bacterium]MCM1493147.1 topoisomerase C-terminal repeat-containing protein [Muribaculaceae bacterium]